jgi:hypothetical protein
MKVASMTAVAISQGLETGCVGLDWGEFGCGGAAAILFP